MAAEESSPLDAILVAEPLCRISRRLVEVRWHELSLTPFEEVSPDRSREVTVQEIEAARRAMLLEKGWIGGSRPNRPEGRSG
jgi:hypothetical protein